MCRLFGLHPTNLSHHHAEVVRGFDAKILNGLGPGCRFVVWCNNAARWHDVRHTFGTRLYVISVDIHLVQRAMNHSNVATTMRYVHTDREDIREAMEKLPFRKANDPSARTWERRNSPAKTKWCGREESAARVVSICSCCIISV